RITVTGDLKQVADFLAGVEHGPTRVLIPFLEISRRGAVLRGKAARALSATVEVTAFLQGAPLQAAVAEGKAGGGKKGSGEGKAPAGAAHGAGGEGEPVAPGAAPSAGPPPSGGTV